MVMRCKDCEFTMPIGMVRNGNGEETPVNICRRFPPQLNVSGSSTFPIVADGEWCGEFKPKAKPKAPVKPKPARKR